MLPIVLYTYVKRKFDLSRSDRLSGDTDMILWRREKSARVKLIKRALCDLLRGVERASLDQHKIKIKQKKQIKNSKIWSNNYKTKENYKYN